MIGLIVLRPTGDAPSAPGVIPGTTFVGGRVIALEPDVCPEEYPTSASCSTAQVRVTSGPDEGDIVELPNVAGLPSTPELRAGDRIRMAYFAKGAVGHRYTFDDFQRGRPMLVLTVGFAVAVILLGRLQGVRALLGMVVSLVIVIAYLLPALLRGGPPVTLALVTALAIAVAVLYLAHGVHVGTHVAFAGSAIALGLATGLGALFIGACHLTGYTDDTVASLTVAAGSLDVRGLILAGLVIGALGVLDDMTVTQVSAVAEVQAANPSASAFALYRAGMRVGKDHVASTVNTLFLAYAGASLPLLLLFAQGGRSITGVLTSEVVAVELVRALIGSIGLVAAVPITTGLAAWVIHQGNDETDDPDGPDEAQGWDDLAPIPTAF
ncbi:MAG: YibE/F family protein [Acidimicrobiales bacterium]